MVTLEMKIRGKEKNANCCKYERKRREANYCEYTREREKVKKRVKGANCYEYERKRKRVKVRGANRCEYKRKRKRVRVREANLSTMGCGNPLDFQLARTQGRSMHCQASVVFHQWFSSWERLKRILLYSYYMD